MSPTKSSHLQFYVFALAVPLFVTGCTKTSRERQYEEIVISAPASTMPMTESNSRAGSGFDMPATSTVQPSESLLSWDVPSGWKEVPAQGMRVATFQRADDPEAIDVSIVSLGGMAGGVEANLSRWAKQIELNIDPSQLSEFIASAPVVKTKAGVDAAIFDFTKFQKDVSSKSMTAAMMEIDGATVFVKMTGTLEAVFANKESFKQLTLSVRQK